MDKYKIYYDANFAVNEHRGMGKYINNFTNVLHNSFGLECIGLLTGNQKKNEMQYRSFGFSNYIFWEQFSLLKYRNDHKGIMIFPYNTAPIFLKKTPYNVLIVHDLIFFKKYETKSLKQKIGKLYRRLVLPRIISKFDHIVTVSEHTRTEMKNFFNLDASKISVLPNSIILKKNFEDDNPKFEYRDNYFFHIGGEPSYKNSLSVLYAFSGLGEDIRSNYKLKIIGIRDPKALCQYQNVADQLKIRSQIEFLKYQTDAQIIELYKRAKMFIFSSFEEGFGIPILEAFKYGCPLLCSNSSCFPEIANDGGNYFDPNNAHDIANVIMRVLAEPNQTKAKVLKGYDRVKAYSFDSFSNLATKWFERNLGNIQDCTN
jgi:glycosyltransferase involved in cell wall biosynthesis